MGVDDRKSKVNDLVAKEDPERAKRCRDRSAKCPQAVVTPGAEHCMADDSERAKRCRDRSAQAVATSGADPENTYIKRLQ